MKDYRIRLQEDKFYHIFNRGINSTNLFYNKNNYEFFLRRYDEYMTDFVDTFAFCLLPNHFHVLVRVKESLHDSKEVGTGPVKDVSDAFQRLFTSYAKAINKQEKRHGALFEKPFRRIEVDSPQYLAYLVFYIHSNPQKHRICNDFRDYPWSSYERILKNIPSKLQKQAVIDWFDSTDNYVEYHSHQLDIAEVKGVVIE